MEENNLVKEARDMINNGHGDKALECIKKILNNNSNIQSFKLEEFNTKLSTLLYRHKSLKDKKSLGLPVREEEENNLIYQTVLLLNDINNQIDLKNKNYEEEVLQLKKEVEQNHQNKIERETVKLRSLQTKRERIISIRIVGFSTAAIFFFIWIFLGSSFILAILGIIIIIFLFMYEED